MGGGYSMKLWVEVYGPAFKTHALFQTRRIYFWHLSFDFCGLLEPNFQLNSTSCFRPWNKTYPFSGKKYKNPYPISKKNRLKTIPFGAVHTGVYIADIEEFILPCNPSERRGELENSGSTIKDINHKNRHNTHVSMESFCANSRFQGGPAAKLQNTQLATAVCSDVEQF